MSFFSRRRKPMLFIPYSVDEILNYFDEINCLQDVQVVADYLNENSYDYSLNELGMLNRLLRCYIDLFV